MGNKLKRELLIALAKEDYYHNDPDRHDYIRRKYAKFVIPLDEAEWVGLDLNEACRYDIWRINRWIIFIIKGYIHKKENLFIN